MASNKNALIRYKTINNCLRNNNRDWTLDDLITACSDALYEYEGKDIDVSKRTIQLDIQMMRSDKLGYNAPIEVYDKKYYRYEDFDFSITNIPVTKNDLEILHEAVSVLQHFKDFSVFEQMGGVLKRLEDVVYTNETQTKSVIHLDKNDDLRGLHYLDVLYKAIINKKVLEINYQSFKALQAAKVVFHPLLLKEYNNRWFLIGRLKPESVIVTFALDRIEGIELLENQTFLVGDFDGDSYYQNTIGVTVTENNHPKYVVFSIDKKNAPYVKTKPFHHSQEIIEETENGTIFKILVTYNFELERLFLGFGNAVEVLKPNYLRKRIALILQSASEQYATK